MVTDGVLEEVRVTEGVLDEVLVTVDVTEAEEV